MMTPSQNTVAHTPLKFLLGQIKQEVQEWCYLIIKGVCFFRGEGATDFHKVSTFPPDQKVQSRAKLLEDSELLEKLSNGDMIAQNAMYRLSCLLALYQKISAKINI